MNLRLLALCSLGGALACGQVDPDTRTRRAQRDQLRREVVGYRGLEPLARTGLMTSEEEVILTVSDTLIRGLLSAAFPLPVRIGGGITVTMTGATVAFRANVARVDIVGQVRRESFPAVAASIVLRGALDAFEVDSARVLRARITVDDADVSEPTGVPGIFDGVAVVLLQRAVERSLPELAMAIPNVAIPVRFHSEISLPGFNPKGALTIPPARAPLTMAVSRVIAFDDRIWVILHTTLGEFVRAEVVP